MPKRGVRGFDFHHRYVQAKLTWGQTRVKHGGVDKRHYFLFFYPFSWAFFPISLWKSETWLCLLPLQLVPTSNPFLPFLQAFFRHLRIGKWVKRAKVGNVRVWKDLSAPGRSMEAKRRRISRCRTRDCHHPCDDKPSQPCRISYVP